ncbi:UV excision repair protein rad23, partial [Coemansia nantahalensis]
RTASVAAGSRAEPETPSPPARALPGQESQSADAAPAAQPLADTGFLSGEQYETAISNMVEMGYLREHCIKAMRASFNNPDRAVEYLLNGIPEAGLAMADSREAAQDSQQQQPAGNLFEQAARVRPSSDAQGRAGADGLTQLRQLRGTPQFRQLQQLVRANPQMLTQVLMQLAQQQPQLMRLIRAHEEEFLQMLLEGMSEEDMARLTQNSGLAGMGLGDDGDDSGGAGHRDPYLIQVTQADMEAIGRLQALGFSREVVIQAYIACEKNEEYAANYLFDHGHDDDDDDVDVDDDDVDHMG